HPAVSCVDGDDLGRPQVFGAEHSSSHRRAVGQADMLRTHAKHQGPRSALLADLRHRESQVAKADAPLARAQTALELEEIHRRGANEISYEHAGRAGKVFVPRTHLLHM